MSPLFSALRLGLTIVVGFSCFGLTTALAQEEVDPDGVRLSLLGGFHPQGTSMGAFPLPNIPAPAVESGDGFEGAVAIDDLSHPYLAFGGRLSVLSTDLVVEGDAGTIVTVALTFAPRVRLKVSSFELYFSPMFGLSVTAPPSEDFELGEGYHVDLVGGVHLNMTEHLGVFVEAGFSSHWVSFPTELTTPMGESQSLPFETRLQRFVVRLGLSYEVF